jgi:hypothetical protein
MIERIRIRTNNDKKGPQHGLLVQVYIPLLKSLLKAFFYFDCLIPGTHFCTYIQDGLRIIEINLLHIQNCRFAEEISFDSDQIK